MWSDMQEIVVSNALDNDTVIECTGMYIYIVMRLNRNVKVRRCE